jgi:ribosomal protein L14
MNTYRILSALSLSFVLANLSACGGGSSYEGPSTPSPGTQTLAVSSGSSATLMPTELRKYDVTGGVAPYKATSSNTAVALASVSDSTLSVAAIQGNTAPISVVVTDSTGAKATVAVSVSNSPALGSFTLTPSVLAVAPGATKTFIITGGTAPYAVSSATPSVATAGVTGNVVTVTGVTEGVDVVLRVIDSLGVTQTAKVSVAATSTSGSGAALFSNMPLRPTLPPVSMRTFTIGGGTGPYTAVSSNPAVVSPAIRGAALTLQTGSAGTATLVVTDNVGAQITQLITVQRSAAPLALSSTALTAVLGTTTTVNIAGGTPPYKALADGTLVAKGTIINGDILNLEMALAGKGTVSVTDAENNIATIAVTVTPLLSKFTISPTEVVISELLGINSAGAYQQTYIPLTLLRPVYPVLVFSSYPRLLLPTINGNMIEVRTPGTAAAPVAPCVDLDTPVVITVIDATGVSATTTITITDNGVCPG